MVANSYYNRALPREGVVATPYTKYGLEKLIMALASFLLNHNKQIETQCKRMSKNM